MATVLVTGATGYIGGRLLRHLEDDGRAVRCLARRPERVRTTTPRTEVVRGDCLEAESLPPALSGIEVAYYLVHSMATGSEFARLDRQAAQNFADAAARAGVRRIVYLGGLVGDDADLSEHLKSRSETGVVLRSRGVPVVEFRSSIIVGAGSLSFEIIRGLVERLPILICPRWVSTLAQPIAIDDVLAYLTAALDLPEIGDAMYEIGGPRVMSYGDMMREYARLRGLTRYLLPVPVLTPRLSGLWLALFTPAQAAVGRALVHGLRNSTIVKRPTARTSFAIEPMPLDLAFGRAIAGSAEKHVKRDVRSLVVPVSTAAAFAPIRSIGGQAGWYFANLLWQLRGWIDRLFGGVGMSRGRRDCEDCQVGDTIDGWRVEAYEPNRRLRLTSDMKLPGTGWLEFEVVPRDEGRASEIRQTATFDARGLLGRLYWLATVPLHAPLFRGLLRNIGRRAVIWQGTR